MKKYLFLTGIIIFCLLYGCSSATSESSATGSSEQSSKVSTASEAISSVPESSTPPKDEALLSKISVNYRADTLIDENGKQRMLIDFENKSDKIFSGDVMISFWGNQKMLGEDVFPIKDFKPGARGTGEVYIIPSEQKTFTFDISDYSFSEDTASQNGTLNNEKSKKAKDYLDSNFGGGGKPELATSWYAYIKKVEVYNLAGSSYAIVSVSTGDSQSIQRIGNTILNIDTDGVTLSEVIVQNESGEELFRKSK